MFPFEKSLSGAVRDEMHFQWFDMARLNYLMARFSALMQIPIQETPYSVALDIFPKPGQPQDCLQGFYGNYELFSTAPAPRLPLPLLTVALRVCISFPQMSLLLLAGDVSRALFFSNFRPFSGVILNYAEPAWQVLPSSRFPKADKLLAIFVAFCRLACPEVADRKPQHGMKPRLATAEFCRTFCPGLEPFMQCFREGNVTKFRQLQQRHAESLWRLGLTVCPSLSLCHLLSCHFQHRHNRP